MLEHLRAALDRNDNSITVSVQYVGSSVRHKAELIGVDAAGVVFRSKSDEYETVIFPWTAITRILVPDV